MFRKPNCNAVTMSLLAGLFLMATVASAEQTAVNSIRSSANSGVEIDVIVPHASRPVLTPGSGTYRIPQYISISDSTSNAMIYYTLDGTTPTTASLVYESPIKISRTETVKAVAVARGYASSPTGVGAYAIKSYTATPIFSLAGGGYRGVQTVSISDSTPGAIIYYTTDGSTPNTSSSVYSRDITVSNALETIKAIAIAPGDSQSATATETYSLLLPIAESVL
jgi:hypothetical protein